MAVFRVEKNTNFTVMSNHHLKNKKLSLKAKGLLSQILSLPAEWDYSLNGLAYINKEGKDSVREAIKELEREGYIVRTRIRDDKGLLGKAEYVIYETPHLENTDFQPKSENPTLDNPTLENPTLENPTQLNIDIINKELLNKDSIPFHSDTKRNGNDTASTPVLDTYYEIIKSNIEYDILKEDKSIDTGCLTEIVDLMLETLCTTQKSIRISGNNYPAELVKKRILEINSLHIQFVFDCMKQNHTKVKNIKKYMLAVLFNAKTTMENYYSALCQYDGVV